MRYVTRGLRTVLTAAAVVCVATVSGREVVAGQGAASPASPMSDRARVVGTYELVTTEIKDPSRLGAPPNLNDKATRRMRPLDVLMHTQSQYRCPKC
jgi:hypothetical protein